MTTIQEALDRMKAAGVPAAQQQALKDFIGKEIPSVPFFKPDGKPKKEWRIFYGESWDAAMDAARDAARDAAWDAAWDAAMDAAMDAAWGAVWAAAGDAAWDALRPTVVVLQASAHQLVDRMIAVTEPLGGEGQR